MAAELCKVGREHYQRGRLREARSAWEQALVANPCHVFSLCNLGLLSKEEGRPLIARQLYERALAINHWGVTSLPGLLLNRIRFTRS